MAIPVKWRLRARNALESYFHRHSYPRVALSAIVTTAGLVGFLLSYGLLHEGVEQMGVRYFVAVLGAWATTLGLLRIWVELEQRRFDHERFAAVSQEPVGVGFAIAEEPAQPRHARPRRRGPSLEWLRVLDGCDLDIDLEGCLAVVIVGALIAAIAWVFVFVLTSASSLLAEVFLDAFFVSALYRRPRVAAVEHWLGTAVRRTGPQALLLAVSLALAGWLLQHYAPDTHSIGPALRELIHLDPP